ncbi:ATP/GTP-binding protein [Infirmifilum lucidum]|uniref:ATP/GTP-binding protein n=1 Tax=Infirmifilum lucidum TaxID=2776706 RepID=A0A7L9FGR8_9CREN|nr:ATP/GTP-binding protein [Infirmifilum lucidum]QOJ78203.1 ATP/GTP-binding protein [Infirmifilum lucidum]
MKSVVLFIGPAGSGKTSLTAAFGKWLWSRMVTPAAYVNLDPGVEYLPYRPDIDIRQYVTVEEVMKKYGLGPNGALIKSIEIACKYLDDILERASKLPAPYVLVDTPGQMELFLFREFGPRFVEKFKKAGHIIGVVILDPTLMRKAQDIVSLKLLSLLTSLRLGVDVIPVINKADAVEEGEILRDDERLRLELSRESEGVIGEISERILDLLNDYRLATRVPLVSATTGKGLEELYDMLHEIFCACGDLT